MGELFFLILAIGVMLFLGDRLGWLLGCVVAKRRRERPTVQLPCWMDVTIALLIPTLILAGLFTPYALSRDRNSFEHLVDNMEMLMLAAFFITGIAGGLVTRLRK